MKRFLALALVFILVLSSILLVSCDNSPEPTETPNEPQSEDGIGEKLAGKTPEETYKAIAGSISKMTSYDISISATTDVVIEDETISSETKSEFRKNGDHLYCKYLNSSSKEEELWYVDGYMYYCGSDNQERAQMSEEDFISNYFVDISNNLMPLSSSDFEDKNFVTDGEIYLLRFEFTPEEFANIVGESISGNAKYTVCFDSKGIIMSVELKFNKETSGGYSISETRLFEVKNVGAAEEISLPEDADEYRVAPALKDIDRGEIYSLNNVEVSESATDHIMIDVAEYGKIVIRLYPDVAPTTVAKIKELVAAGAYDGTDFHRVIADFVVQGGDTGTSEGAQGIFGEFNINGFTNRLSHLRGVVSMARANDYNSGYDQFFIVHKDSVGLDGSYAAFGYVIYGMDVVDAIAAVETDDSGMPNEEVIMTSVSFVTVP